MSRFVKGRAIFGINPRRSAADASLPATPGTVQVAAGRKVFPGACLFGERAGVRWLEITGGRYWFQDAAAFNLRQRFRERTAKAAEQMRMLTGLGAAALFALSASAALAVPMCDPDSVSGKKSLFSQDEVIRSIEADLRAQGIKVHNSRLWNNCLQTFVTVNGHDVMKFYDPNTRREIPLN
jgi:hypothetical protein